MNKNLIVYEKITNVILDRLAAGVIPWRKPWACKGGANTPRNFITKKPYRGINLWLLAGAYAAPFWLTFNQARALGAKVRKGEKATTVVFWQIFKRKDAKTGEEKKAFFLRYYSVFNVEQCDGIPADKLAKVKAQFAPEVVAADFDPSAKAEEIIAGYKNCPELRFGGDRAFYRIEGDFCQLPEKTDFVSPGAYYGTNFHELAHSTGAKNRLNRPGIAEFDRFGSEQYAKEELVAEFCSTFLLAQCDLEQPLLENSAAYIANWSEKIKKDHKLIIGAASQAQAAADYILGVSPETVKADDDEEPASTEELATAE